MGRHIILCFFSFAFTFGLAQEEWSIERCIQHALENNLTIKQSELNVDFAAIDLKQAKHSRYPSLNSSFGVNSNFGRSVDPISNDFVSTNFISNGLSLNTGVTLFNGFRIANSIKRSNIDRQASEYDLDQTKRDIALTVANNYLNVLFAQENLAIANSQLSTSQEQLQQIDRLINAGVRPANESLDIKAQIANNEQMVISAENNKEIALLGLKQLLMLDPDVSMVLIAPENVTLESDPDQLTFNDVYNNALSSQPNVKAGNKRIESARMSEKIAKAGLTPSIGVGGSLGSNYSNQGRKIIGTNTVPVVSEIRVNGIDATIETEQQIPVFDDNPYFNQIEENLSYGVGINVSYPIYNNYTTRANIERSKLSIINSENQQEQLKNQLRTTVQQALADAKAAKKKLNAATKSVEAQTASFSNSEKRFNAGTINSFEYVSVKNALQQAEVNAIIAKYEYLFAMKIIDFYMGKPIKL